MNAASSGKDPESRTKFIPRHFKLTLKDILYELKDHDQAPFEIITELVRDSGSDETSRSGAGRVQTPNSYGVKTTAEPKICNDRFVLPSELIEAQYSGDESIRTRSIDMVDSVRVIEFEGENEDMIETDTQYRRVRIISLRRSHGVKWDPTGRVNPRSFLAFAPSIGGRNIREGNVPSNRHCVLFGPKQRSIARAECPKVGYSLPDSCHHFAKAKCIFPSSMVPNEMKDAVNLEDCVSNIFFSSVPPWEMSESQKLTWSASGDMSHLVCYQVDVLSLVLDGWKASMNLQGLWYTRDPIPSGYWLKIFSWAPTVRIKMIRTFHVTEYASHLLSASNDFAYKHSRHGTDGEFDRGAALADKVVPTVQCLRCMRLNVYGTSSCVSCDACTTVGCDFIDSSWLPPPMYTDVEGVPNRHIDTLRRMAGRDSWNYGNYGWLAYPYPYDNDTRVDQQWNKPRDKSQEDTVGGKLSFHIRQVAQDEANHSWPKNHIQQRYVRTAMRKFIFMSHISSVIGRAQDNGYLLRLPKGFLTILAAVSAGDQWDSRLIESPMAKCSSLEKHEENLISHAREWRIKNPGGFLDPTKSGVPNGFIKFRGVIDRIQRDRAFRLRLYSSYLNQPSRMDKFVIANNRYYRYAFVLESKIREMRSQLTFHELTKTYFVPEVTPIHARHTEYGLADAMNNTFDDETKELTIDGITPHITMASVKEVNLKGLEEWRREYEVIVPNKYNNDDLARANLVHPSSLPSDPFVISSTGLEGGADDVMPSQLDLDDIAKTAWKQMIKSECCRCGTRHFPGSVSRHSTCAFCWSPVCCNNRCQLAKCRGLVALAGINMAAAQESRRFAPTELIVTGKPPMSIDEYREAIALASSVLKKGMAQTSGSLSGTGVSNLHSSFGRRKREPSTLLDLLVLHRRPLLLLLRMYLRILNQTH